VQLLRFLHLAAAGSLQARSSKGRGAPSQRIRGKLRTSFLHISETDCMAGTAVKAKLVNTPELKDQRNATVLYVFAL
jgi:hypothetical protein